MTDKTTTFKLNFRQLFLGLIALAFIWIIYTHFAQVKQVFIVLLQGKWYWLGIALIIEFFYFLIYANIYQRMFKIVGVKKTDIYELLQLTFASIFINVAIPLAGASSIALFVDSAVARNQSAAKTAIGATLSMIGNIAAFLGILFVGLMLLAAQQSLKPYILITASILFMAIFFGYGLIILSFKKPKIVGLIFRIINTVVKRLAGIFGQAKNIKDSWVDETIHELETIGVLLKGERNKLLKILLLAFISHLAGVTALFFTFLAFGGPFSIALPIIAYSIAILFTIISITPQGIGFSEGAIILVLSSLGTPIATATVIALAFRGISFWLPFLAGFFILNRFKADSSRKSLAK
ncbi:MAG: lysylphosphatidylglycerol synthase transmembrane domain-containing protein [Patescibacteria group bacterium]